MLSVNKTNAIQSVTGIVPVILSISFLKHNAWWILGLCVLSLFILVATIPLFKKKRKSIYVFACCSYGLSVKYKTCVLAYFGILLRT